MNIRDLKKIIDLVNTYKSDFVGPLDRFFIDKKYPKLAFLYKLVKEEKAKTDDDAAFLALNSTPFTEEYQKIKAEFQDRIINLVFFIDSNKLNRNFLGRTTMKTAKHMAAARILINHGEDNAVVPLMEETYLLNKALERTDWGFMLLNFLVTYAAYQNRPDDFDKYSSELLLSYDSYKYELHSEIYKQELTLAFLKSESEKYKYAAKSKKYFELLRDWYVKSPTYTLFFNMIEVGVYYGYITRNYQLIIDLANERDSFMLKNPQFKNTFNNAKSAIVRLESYLYLREYEKGKEEARNCLELFLPGTVNWLAFLEYYFLLCMHAKNYAQSLNVYYEVLKHPSFPDLNPEYKERWKYFEPYLNYLVPDDFLKENFDMLSFLDEISYYTEHKSDNNIVVMIGQIIIMIDVGELDKLSSRTHYLDSYINKYVNKTIYPRTDIFLRMLLHLFETGFNADKAEKEMAGQWKKLLPDKKSKLFATEPLEIIPYEQLWVSLLEKLRGHAKTAEKKKNKKSKPGK